MIEKINTTIDNLNKAVIFNIEVNNIKKILNEILIFNEGSPFPKELEILLLPEIEKLYEVSFNIMLDGFQCYYQCNNFYDYIHNNLSQTMKSIEKHLSENGIILTTKYDYSEATYFSDLELILQIMPNSKEAKRILERKGEYKLKFDEQFNIKREDFGELQTIFSNEYWSLNKSTLTKTCEEVYITSYNKSVLSEEKFHRLISVLKRARHPNLEDFLGSFVTQYCYCVVTKRYEFSLHKNIIYIPNYEATIIAYKIASAMAYLHSIDVIHRDLCTCNVTINEDFDVKIVGFVNSRFLPLHSINLSYQPPSSIQFRAPEIILCDSYTSSVDTFSFGTILYQLLTKELPFSSLTNEDITKNLINNILPDFSPSTPAPLENLIKACWNQKQELRPSFSQIIDTMINEQITFPCVENLKTVQQFYSDIQINSYQKECISEIENIIQLSHQSIVYTAQITRMITILYKYMFYLETPNDKSSNFAENGSLCLKSLLTEFHMTLKHTLKEEWLQSYFKEDFNIIPNKLTELMSKIFEEIKKLRFEEVQKYHIITSDEIEDLRDLYNIFTNKRINLSTQADKVLKCLENKGYKYDLSDAELNGKFESLFKNFYNLMLDDIYNSFDIDKKEIGSGISSTVYSGRRRCDQKQVAIKKYNKEYINKYYILNYIIREISILSSIKTCHVIDFVGFYKESKTPFYIVTGLAKNGTLSENLKSLDGITKTKIAFQIATGMEILHNNSIIHRDLKSDNILLDENYNPKICDFGCAIVNLIAAPLADGAGTNFYKAPEVIKTGIHSYSSDIFAFGVILYQLLTGMRPFENDNFRSKTFMQEPNKLIFDSKTPQNLVSLIEWAKNPFLEKRAPSFTVIIKKMIKENIAFPDTDQNLIAEFYWKKFKKRIQKNLDVSGIINEADHLDYLLSDNY